MVKVLFVIGKGRSGSTLLDNLLGEVEGLFSTGELWRIWDWGVLAGDDCGCGRPVVECDVWRPILDATDSIADAVTNARRIRELLSWRRIPANLANRSDDSLLRSVSETRGRLYETIAERTGAQVIVDSSKMPGDPALLGAVPGIEPYVLHLVRDPRAVAFSWRRKKEFSGRRGVAAMPRYGWIYSGVSWVARNALAEIVRRRTPESRRQTLRYEDLATDPAGSIRRILGMMGMADTPLDFLEGRTARLHPNHTVAGNPSRMRTGPIELRRDDEWREAVPRAGWWTVTALCAPLLGRYGYAAGRR
jgi:hypothetical protein